MLWVGHHEADTEGIAGSVEHLIDDRYRRNMHRPGRLARADLGVHALLDHGKDRDGQVDLDDERIKPWKKVTIRASVNDDDVELMTGYITGLKPHIESDENKCWLEIHGLDGSSIMSLEEKIKDWPNKSDSDIAREIFQSYGLAPQVDETLVVHDEAVATIIQRESDIQFTEADLKFIQEKGSGLISAADYDKAVEANIKHLKSVGA